MMRAAPNILLLGAHGQVGLELQRSLSTLGQVQALGSQAAPLHNLSALDAVLAQTAPHVIVNAAAYTAVDRAEADPDMARAVNAAGPAHLAAWCAKQQALLIHYSTDYVFDGGGSHFRTEAEATGPLNVYGQTKLEGEQAIAASGCAHLIFRTSWVYGLVGDNFARTMLRLASERDALSVVRDQFGAPTGADLIADVTALALHKALGGAHDEKSAIAQQEMDVCSYLFDSKTLGKLGGVFHLVAAGCTNWCDYAQHVVSQAQLSGVSFRCAPDHITGIPSSAYPKPAARPLNSRLSTQKLEQAFGLAMPPWQQGVDRAVQQWAKLGALAKHNSSTMQA
jgi:dTDP-4-dehydrorhamnose reductase